jgi:hypothetical protein
MEYKDLTFDQQIEARLTISLSTESAIEWLKSNALKKNLTGFDRGSDELKDFINFYYAKRNDPNLSLAIARYGTHIETLKKLYGSDDPFIKTAILANPLVGPEGFLQIGILDENAAEKLILDPKTTRQQLDALFTNPKIVREFLVKVLNREGKFKDLSEDGIFLSIVRSVSLNPICSEKYDNTILDGFGEYQFGKLADALLSLLLSAPVNQSWALTLNELIVKVSMSHLPDKISANILSRWFDPETKEDADEPSDEMLGGFFWLRKTIAKILLKSHRAEDKKEISPNHQDKAVRLAYYENTSPSELFQTNVFDKNFTYPSWEYRKQYDQDDNQKKFVSACEKYFALDKNDFIDSLIGNLSFWKRNQERALLQDLSWNLAEDEYSSMMVPNNYNARESYMLSKYPQFFNDDDFADVPEELSMDNKIEKINEQLKKIDSRLENLSFEEIVGEQRDYIKNLLDETNEQLENVRINVENRIKENSGENLIQRLINRIEMIEKKQLSSGWMWLIIFLLILILLTKH